MEVSNRLMRSYSGAVLCAGIPCSTVSARRTLILTSTREPSRFHDRYQAINSEPPEIRVADAREVSCRSLNSFFGNGAGFNNKTGSFNSFFGKNSGIANSSGNSNSFFGVSAGSDNSTGSSNSFFGNNSGRFNTSGSFNSFLGLSAGFNNRTGINNSFFGRDAGLDNTAGSNLTIIGSMANVGADGLSFATAIGAGAVVNTSNTVVLGRSADTVRIPVIVSSDSGTIVSGRSG